MTEASSPRPVPQPGRAAPGAAGPDDRADPAGRAADAPAAGHRFAGLAGRPLTEHVEVFEAEHERLQAELGSIDRV